MLTEVVVVEGRDDTRRLKEVFGDIDTIETQGSAINEEIIELIKTIHEKRGAIVLTDPDFSGEKIRKVITDAIPTIKHAFITVEEGKPKHKGGSLGVEHASKEALYRALTNLQQGHVTLLQANDLPDRIFLVKQGLIGSVQSAKLRDALCRSLKIGHTNGKQLEKRLKMFDITREDVMRVLHSIKEKYE